MSRESNIERALTLENEERRARGLERLRPIADVGEGLVDFTSSDVLGLSGDPRLIAGAVDFAERFGSGARAARLLGGAARATRLAEEAAIEWLGGGIDALAFPSGYQANVSALSYLGARGDVFFSDALCHASLIDGMRLSRAETRVHRHLDLDHLEELLRSASGARRRIVVTESVFSMDGDGADIARLSELCRRYDAWAYVDEAHAGGIVGPRGRGACADVADALDGVSLVRLFTGGKALGVAGAFVVAEPAVIAALLQSSRGHVFTTGVSPLVAGALASTIAIVDGADELRAQLFANRDALCGELGAQPNRGVIVPLSVGDAQHTMEVAATLRSNGFDVRGVRPPTVPAGTSRLRFVCHAAHTTANIRDVAATLRTATKDLPSSQSAGVVQEQRAPLFVVGTDTDAGKTVASAALMCIARRLGSARYFKPMQTGDDSDTQTVAHLAELPSDELHAPVYHFAKPASPHEAAREESARVEPDVLNAGFHDAVRAANGAQLVVELAGGLLVPYNDDGYDQSEFLAQHARRLVLVARSGVGTLNHTRLTLEALERRGLRPCALILVGEPHASNRATLAKLVEHVVELPRFKTLGAQTLSAWVDERFEPDRLATIFQ